MAENLNRPTLNPDGPLILGAFSLAPTATDQYFSARTKARETSIQAEFLVRDWRGSVAAGNFYHQQLDEAIDRAVSADIEPKEIQFSKEMKKVIEESALALEVPNAEVEKSFRDAIKSMAFRLQNAKSGDEFAKIAERLHQECPVSSAQIWELGRDAEKAKALAIAAAADLVVARNISLFNLVGLVATIIAGIAMLWSALTGRWLPKDQVEAHDEVETKSESCESIA